MGLRGVRIGSVAGFTSLAILMSGFRAHALDPSVVRPAPGAPALKLPAGQGPKDPVAVKAEQLTQQELDSLASEALVEVHGTRVTAGVLRARVQARTQQFRAEAEAAARALAAQVAATFESRRAQFLKAQQAALEAAHAKARAELARLRQASAAAPPTQRQVIQREAIELLNRSKTATPAEQAQIEQRAGQLLKQLESAPR